MTVAAHQPNFLPNLAFFYKMLHADLFIIISNLQFEKNEGWQQRHKIKGPNGDIWLTVPVLGSQQQLIKDVLINNNVNWRKKHINSIKFNYSKSVGKEYVDEFSKIYEKDWNRLADISFAGIVLLRDILGIKSKLILDEEVSGTKEELLINICKKYGADTYLSGSGASTYLTDERMSKIYKNKIKHSFVNRNLTPLYPYSTVHYLLKNGKEWINKEVFKV